MRFNIVRSSTLFTFGYPNLMLSFLQYISSYFNINIATFVGFQIAIYAYVVLRCRTFTYTRPSSRVNAYGGRLVSHNILKCYCHEIFDIFFIALVRYSNVYEYFDVQMSNIRAREVDEFLKLAKTGFHWHAKFFGAMFWACDVIRMTRLQITTDHNKKTTSKRR